MGCLSSSSRQGFNQTVIKINTLPSIKLPDSLSKTELDSSKPSKTDFELSLQYKNNHDILGKSPKIHIFPPKPISSPRKKPNMDEPNYEDMVVNEIMMPIMNHEIKDNDPYETEIETIHDHGNEQRLSYRNETETTDNKMFKRLEWEENRSIQQNGSNRKKDHPFIKIIKTILSTKTRPVGEPPLKFEFSEEAATKNWETINKFGSLDILIRNSPFSPMTYGSEFKESWILYPIFNNHHLWP